MWCVIWMIMCYLNTHLNQHLVSSFFRYIDSVNVGSVRFKFFHHQHQAQRMRLSLEKCWLIYLVFVLVLIHDIVWHGFCRSIREQSLVHCMIPQPILCPFSMMVIFFEFCQSFSSSPEVYSGAFTLFLFSSSSSACKNGSIKLVWQLH